MRNSHHGAQGCVLRVRAIKPNAVIDVCCQTTWLLEHLRDADLVVPPALRGQAAAPGMQVVGGGFWAEVRCFLLAGMDAEVSGKSQLLAIPETCQSQQKPATTKCRIDSGTTPVVASSR